MIGNPEDEGVVFRGIDRLFDGLKERGVDRVVEIACVEIYNERLKDLLCTADDPPQIRVSLTVLCSSPA